VARKENAADLEIYDTVLIAAAFCMYNRFVDGLGTWQPDDEPLYDKWGKLLRVDGVKKSFNK